MAAFLRIVAMFVVLAAHATAFAVALRSGRTTDASVCDLGPDTSFVIGSKVLIPAAVRTDIQAEAYLRVATKFIADHCANAQTLIVRSEDSSSPDPRYLPEVAARACVVADIRRTNITSRVDEREEHGFELRCIITKLEALKSEVMERERTSPTDAFLARLQQQAVAGSSGGAPAPGPANKKDCGKMTLASILTGGSCK